MQMHRVFFTQCMAISAEFQQKDQPKEQCHCEGRRPVAIRSLPVPHKGDGQCFALKGMRIATACGLAMTVIVES